MGMIAKRFQGMRSGDPGKLAVLMATAFVDMVGGLIVIPLLPFSAKGLGANGFKITILVAAFSAMQLVSAPFWGRFSDKYGRKPSLLWGLGISGVAYIVFAFSGSLWLLLLSRLVQGMGGGTTGVIQAYVADSVEPENRARALGWLSAATNTGVVIGPVIGSLSAHFGLRAPGLVAAALCTINIFFAQRFLTESHGAAARKLAMTARPPMRVIEHVLIHPLEPASRLILIYAVALGAFYGVNAMLILFLAKYYAVTQDTIFIFFLYVGALNIVLRILVVGPVVDRFGEARTSRAGTALLALGLFLIPLTRPLAHGTWFTYLPIAIAVGLLPLGTTFSFPAVTALLSRVVSEHERGLYMGVQQTYGGLVRVFYPLYAGWAWDHLGDRVPFWTSSILVASTMLLSLGMHGYVRPKAAEAVVPVESGG